MHRVFVCMTGGGGSLVFLIVELCYIEYQK